MSRGAWRKYTKDIYSRSGISIHYSAMDGLPATANGLSETILSALKSAAELALEQTKAQTPYKPNDTRTTQHLRDSGRVVVYRNGVNGGNVYITWSAQNPSNGYHYGIAQEYGYGYSNYTTPGTGPGFMNETFNIIQQVAPELMEEAWRKDRGFI